MTEFITARFRRACTALDRLEGGYSNHPKDRGGPTKFGISQRAYPKLNILRLSRAQAEDIYERDYWAPLRCDKFWSEALALELFEFGVNAGIGTAARRLQIAINRLGRPISADGKVGPATLAAANQVAEAGLLKAFRAEILDYYEDIVRGDPSQAVFLKGWKRRIAEGEASA